MKDHDCKQNIEWDKSPTVDDYIYYEGRCEICGKEFQEPFESLGIQEVDR